MEVARARGFRDAARASGKSASGLSEAVRRLEAAIGVRLLYRTTRSVAPTEVGRRLLEQLGSALTEVESALDVVNGFRDKPAGTLRLNVPVVAARLVLELPDAPASGRVDVAEAPEVRGGTAAIATVVSRAAGIVRSESGLASGEAELDTLTGTTGRGNDGNRWLAARALLAAARHRRESRGCHWRDDFPAAFSAWQRHVPVRLDAGRGIVVDEQERRLLSA